MLADLSSYSFTMSSTEKSLFTGCSSIICRIMRQVSQAVSVDDIVKLYAERSASMYLSASIQKLADILLAQGKEALSLIHI